MSNNCAISVANFLENAEQLESKLHAFTAINKKDLLKEAQELDSLRPDQRKSIHGLLLGVKEVYDVKGFVCGWGTPIHNNRIPTSDSAVVAALKKAGALLAGITVSTEYALSTPGPTNNPHDITRTPGASSQGSAAAVASGLIPAALGSQTIGSIIRPAAYCGCIGFKPSWGLLNTEGTMPLAKILDHPGVFTNGVTLLRDLLYVIKPDHDWEIKKGEKVDVVMIEPWYSEDTDPLILRAVHKACSKLINQGFSVDTIKLDPSKIREEENLVMTLLTAGVAKNHGDDFDRNSSMMSKRIRDYILAGRNVSADDLSRAKKGRENVAQYLERLLRGKVFVTAATVGLAPRKEEGTGSRAPQRLWTLAGFPVLSVPISSHNGLPIGVQIGASWGRDRFVLEIGGHLFGS